MEEIIEEEEVEDDEDDHFDEDDEEDEMMDEQVQPSKAKAARRSSSTTAKRASSAKLSTSSLSSSAAASAAAAAAKKDAIAHPHALVPVPEWEDRPSKEDYDKLSSKEKRQMRNKISARNFRHRRKAHIDTLEDEIKEKNVVIDVMREEMGTLRVSYLFCSFT